MVFGVSVADVSVLHELFMADVVDWHVLLL